MVTSGLNNVSGPFYCDVSGPFYCAYKRYCDNCFRSILDKTKADLDALFVDIDD
jgi:hypothetical protein